MTLSDIVDEVDAILYAWHPGTMGGPAIADLALRHRLALRQVAGDVSAGGRADTDLLQPENGGKPAFQDNVVHIDDIDTFAPQTSLGMSAFHLDTCFTPLFPFGHGLSYTTFGYENIHVSANEIELGQTLVVSVDLCNHGDIEAEEVVQLYTRDLVASITRPVRELKGFRRVRLLAGETQTVRFELHTDALAFYGRDGKAIIEPGLFHVWIGGSSDTELRAEFQIVKSD